MIAEYIECRLSEQWVLASNLRYSAIFPGWTLEPTIHAIVVMFIEVEKEHRQQGHCKRFLQALCDDARFDMVIVEAVQNPILAEALLRWGWAVDVGVMDFYYARSKNAGDFR